MKIRLPDAIAERDDDLDLQKEIRLAMDWGNTPRELAEQYVCELHEDIMKASEDESDDWDDYE